MHVRTVTCVVVCCVLLVQADDTLSRHKRSHHDFDLDLHWGESPLTMRDYEQYSKLMEKHNSKTPKRFTRDVGSKDTMMGKESGNYFNSMEDADIDDLNYFGMHSNLAEQRLNAMTRRDVYDEDEGKDNDDYELMYRRDADDDDDEDDDGDDDEYYQEMMYRRNADDDDEDDDDDDDDDDGDYDALHMYRSKRNADNNVDVDDNGDVEERYRDVLERYRRDIDDDDDDMAQQYYDTLDRYTRGSDYDDDDGDTVFLQRRRRDSDHFQLCEKRLRKMGEKKDDPGFPIKLIECVKKHRNTNKPGKKGTEPSNEGTEPRNDKTAVRYCTFRAAEIKKHRKLGDHVDMTKFLRHCARDFAYRISNPKPIPEKYIDNVAKVYCDTQIAKLKDAGIINGEDDDVFITKNCLKDYGVNLKVAGPKQNRGLAIGYCQFRLGYYKREGRLGDNHDDSKFMRKCQNGYEKRTSSRGPAPEDYTDTKATEYCQKRLKALKRALLINTNSDDAFFNKDCFDDYAQIKYIRERLRKVTTPSQRENDDNGEVKEAQEDDFERYRRDIDDDDDDTAEEYFDSRYTRGTDYDDGDDEYDDELNIVSRSRRDSDDFDNDFDDDLYGDLDNEAMFDFDI